MKHNPMKRNPQLKFPSLVAILFLSASGMAQQQGATLSVNGHSGNAPVIQINGRSYVDVEALARITNGSLGFHANQIMLTLPAGTSTAPGTAPASQPARPGFSKDFVMAAIEEMSVIREWRIAVVNAIQYSTPVPLDWVAGYRRTADSKLALVSAARTTDADRQAFTLLQNQFNNMQKYSDIFQDARQNARYIPPSSLSNDPLDAQIMSCAHGLASLAASGQFEDLPPCH